MCFPLRFFYLNTKVSRLTRLLCIFLITTTLCPFGQSWDDGVSPHEDFDYDDMLPPGITTAQLNYATDDVHVYKDASLKTIKRVKRIIGGNVANHGELPHQVTLRSSITGHFCGATVIHPLLLLSAAHCFLQQRHQPPNIQAIAGDHSLRSSDGNAEQTRDIIHVFKHKKYNDRNFNNDIAVLVLNQSLKFNNYVRPLPVRDPTWELPAHASISGWGWTQSGKLSDELKVAQVPILDHEDCVERTKDTYVAITENMLCAGGNGSAAWMGDTGGPLTCLRNGTDGEEEHFLCGIGSWGVVSNGYKGRFPEVYTDVSKYTGWIQKFLRTWERHYWRIWLGKPRSGPSDCPPGKYYCPNNSLCIPAKFRCNGRNDCHPLENLDELNCTSITCFKGEFQCNSTQICIPLEYACDGDDDCEDASDELDCSNVRLG